MQYLACPQPTGAIVDPAVMGRGHDHGGANGIEFDVALANEQRGSGWTSENL